MSQALYASVLELDRAAIQALRITDPYSLHRAVYSLFDDVRTEAEKSAHKASGIQWVDNGGDANGRQLLMLSDREPATRIDGSYGAVRSKAIPETFLNQSHYRFSVVVCPVRRDSKSRSLVPVRGREAIAAWFVERGRESWGFDVDSASLQVGKVVVQQFTEKAQRKVTLQQAHISGSFQVRDQEQFKKSFSHGIGKGRTFGCGLLQIVPVIENPFS